MWMKNSVDPDQLVPVDPDLHYFSKMVKIEHSELIWKNTVYLFEFIQQFD